MLLTRLKNRLQVDKDSEDDKLIKSVLDIINPPSSQYSDREAGSGDKDKLSNEQPKIVLHIDDDPEDREMVNDTIKSIDPSFIIVEAENGKAGIEILKEAKSAGNLPCLIILDVNMPGMNGFDTYNEIEKDDDLKDLPVVIFTTADFFKGGQRQGNENLPIFIKPDRMKDLVASIQKILTHCKD